jgi:hypothetical protein
VAGTPTRHQQAKAAEAPAPAPAPVPAPDIEFEAKAREERPWWEVEEEEKKKKMGSPKKGPVHREPSIRVRSEAPAPQAQRASTPGTGRAATPMNAAQEVETDEEYDDEDTWEFTDDDAEVTAEVDTTFESVESRNTPRTKMKKTAGRVQPDDGLDNGTGMFLLNVSETKLHNVRKEPFYSSPVIGHLLTDKPIASIADCGDWLKVKYHRPYVRARGGGGARGAAGRGERRGEGGGGASAKNSPKAPSTAHPNRAHVRPRRQ